MSPNPPGDHAYVCDHDEPRNPGHTSDPVLRAPHGTWPVPGWRQSSFWPAAREVSADGCHRFHCGSSVCRRTVSACAPDLRLITHQDGRVTPFCSWECITEVAQARLSVAAGRYLRLASGDDR